MKVLSTSEIREVFLEYFRSKGHTVVKSSPLIPPGDPTLLFTTAGMVQFKPYFLREVEPPYTRATSVQKCLRAGGKASDLENVGKTPRHHTFFEMLGNFSFGDYFKKEAIEYAWEFVTDIVEIPKELIWVSIYEEDDEAFEIWHKHIGLPESRIVRLGAKDNFWGPAGDQGPCGPCSELYIDLRERWGYDPSSCEKPGECDGFLEFWNLVFMQFFQDKFGNRTELKYKGIDTGMGLERLAMILQGKKSVYEIDVFQPIIKRLEYLWGRDYYSAPENVKIAMNVSADHIRAIVFAVSEGVFPSNEGRGYVIRRILRRALRYAKKVGIEKPYLYELVDAVIEAMGNAYPEIKTNINTTKEVIKLEEERFFSNISEALSRLLEEIDTLKSLGKKEVNGEFVFKLYDSMGLPVDIIADVAEDEGMEIDWASFNRLLEEQKLRGKRSWKGLGDIDLEVLLEISQKIKTEYTGENTFEDFGRIVAILMVKQIDRKNKGVIVEELKEGEEGIIITNKSPFYGEMGGQVGDTGIIESPDGSSIATVIDTQRYGGLILHIVRVNTGIFRTDMEVKLRVDGERKKAIARNHTATHLLHKALKEVVGSHVNQAGSLVAPDRLRFDYTHYKALSEEQIKAIEDIVNKVILENREVRKYYMQKEEAIKGGAVALFGEKYGEIVRVVEVVGFSKELCGGTHVNRTGDIGLFKIISESSIASGMRRIEAITGLNSLEYIRKLEEQLNEIADLTKGSRANVLEKVKALISRNKELEKRLKDISIVEKAEKEASIEEYVGEIGGIGIKLVLKRLDGVEHQILGSVVDRVRNDIKGNEGIIAVAGGVTNGKVNLVIGISQNITSFVSAKDILEEVKDVLGGGGGGREDFVRAGGKNIEKVDEIFEKIKNIVKGKLGKKA